MTQELSNPLPSSNSADPSVERLARAALSRLAEPGDIRMLSVVHEWGATAVYEGLLNEQDITGTATDVALRLANVDPHRELEQAAKCGIQFVIPSDPEWPSQLHDLAVADPVLDRGGVPVGLWVRGNLEVLGEVAVAVVGSRSCSMYGSDVAARLSGSLAQEGVCIVSGGAYGIDEAAHRGALAARGPTALVLAGGVDRPYPAAHKELIDYVAQHGVVLSETAPGGANHSYRFLARNRLIAALGVGTVVVEAAIRSGSLNTATWAERLSRVVMGVPGPLTSAASIGVHNLIRNGASLVAEPDHVLELVGRPGRHLLQVPRSRARPRDALSPREQQVLDGVPVSKGVSTTKVAVNAGIDLAEVDTTLDRLLELGMVERDTGGWRLGPRARG